MAEPSELDVEQTDDELCCIEASVVTGFEECARGEAKEKFGVPVQAARGKIVWKVPLSRVKEVVKMGSIDNCRVVLHSVPHFKFSNDQHDCLARLQKIVTDLDWEMGLRVWRCFFDFPHPIASKPDVIPTPDELVDIVIIKRTQYKDPNARRNNKKGGRGKKKERKRDKNSSIKGDPENNAKNTEADCNKNQNSVCEESVKTELVTPEDTNLPNESKGQIMQEQANNKDIVKSSEENTKKKESDAYQEVGKLEENGETWKESETSRTRVILRRPEQKVEVKVLIPGPDENAFPANIDDADHRNVEPMDVDVSMNVSNEADVSPLLKDVGQICNQPSQKDTKSDYEHICESGSNDLSCCPKHTCSQSDTNVDAIESSKIQEKCDSPSEEKLTQIPIAKEEIQSLQNTDLDYTPLKEIQGNVITLPEKGDNSTSTLNESSKKEIDEKTSATKAFASSVIEKLKSPSPVKDFSSLPNTLTPPTTPVVVSTEQFASPNSFSQNLSPASGLMNDCNSVEEERSSGSSVDPPSLSQSCMDILKTLPDSKKQQKTDEILSNENPSSTSLPVSTATTNVKSDSSLACSNDVSEKHSSILGDKEINEKVQKKRDPTKPTFRVTCNRVGENHPFDSSSAAASFGSAVIKYFNWGVDLKHFNIEVLLNIDNDEVTVALALTKCSLHNRNLVAFGPTTLRATICYNMLRLCRIKTGDIVCDPMCGTSALPIEGALNWRNSFHFGGDYHELAIERSLRNMASLRDKLHEENRDALKIGVVQWNLNYFPLREKCVDVFISDLPFGYRMGCRTINRTLYPTLLSEMARTARPGARACLLTEDKTSLIKAIQTYGRFWQRRLILSINMGGLSGFVFLLTRTTSSFTSPKDSWVKVDRQPGPEPDASKVEDENVAEDGGHGQDKVSGDISSQSADDDPKQLELEGDAQERSEGNVENLIQGQYSESNI